MTELAVLTPSYAPDLELCRDLNRSVLEWTPGGVRHHIIVPRRDRQRFAELEGPRTEIWTVDQMLPRRMLALPGLNMWMNLTAPYPPIRGWVMQQVVKLRAASILGADLVVLADSDVVLVRPVTAETFRQDGATRFYRHAGAVDERLPRHMLWHEVAHRLLGLPPHTGAPLPDYISAFNVWEASVVRALLDRIESAAGRTWLDVVARQLHVSEFMLYGVFVDNVLGAAAPVTRTDSMRCHSYWEPSPLDQPAAQRFVDSIGPDDVAVMLSAKSGTRLDIRRAALSHVPMTVSSRG